ncbi:24544_t:CDS:2 [Dentiscutata erythropus]|uniref:24544_t:CDS:1 n=1 Tax=Dentiscutata erythropus TaxID=1348616 RepID=A0A9N9BNI2_9GLOM|nr:24544_t:CDS:2 [Dentiscutata erythropus]
MPGTQFYNNEKERVHTCRSNANNKLESGEEHVTQVHLPTAEKRRFSKKHAPPVFNEDENLRYPLSDNDDIITHSQLLHNIHKYIWQNNFSSPVDDLLRKGSARVLEIGCGDGTWTIDLAKDFTWSLFTGIDAHAKFAQRVEHTNVTFLKADVLDGLPFDPDTFDLVYMRFLSFSEKQWLEKVANEIIRVCKPGGWVEINDSTNDYSPKGSSTTQLEAAYHEYLKSKNIDLIINPKFEDYLRSTNKITVIRREEKRITLGKGGGKVGPLLVQNITATWEQSKKTLSELMGVSEKDIDNLIRTFQKEVNDLKTSTRYGNQARYSPFKQMVEYVVTR